MQSPDSLMMQNVHHPRMSVDIFDHAANGLITVGVGPGRDRRMRRRKPPPYSGASVRRAAGRPGNLGNVVADDLLDAGADLAHVDVVGARLEHRFPTRGL